jgi:putative ABC transport system permease protein
MKDRDAELRAEIQSHLEMAVADRVARGETPEAAAAGARRELGNLSQIQEATLDVWGRRWIGQAAQDVRYAVRVFRRTPGFALVAILSLALGIGANTALFEVVNAVRLRALPVADPATLVAVHIVDREGARGSFETWFPSVTQPVWREIQMHRDGFAGLFAWGRAGFSLSEGGEVRPAEGLWVSGEFFDTLGLTAAAGRLLSPDDDRPGCAARAVLGHGLWRRAYGSDPSAVGRTIRLDSKPVEIVGVAPEPFHGLETGRDFDVALPLCAEPAFSSDGKGRLNAGTTWWLSVFGRLKPGWTVARASAQLAAASPVIFRASLPAAYPPVSVEQYLNFKLAAHPGGAGLSQLREAYGSPLWLLLAIAGVVLVIACANLANLLLARASAREREIAVRLGLGASRGRVIRQLLTESLVLVAIGTGLAMLVARTMGRALVAALETSNNTITLPLGADWRVLAFATGLAITTCLLFGLAPALRGTRMAATAVMRASTRGATASPDSISLRRALVVVQIALSVALLFGALLFARTLHNAATVNPGFTAEGLLIAELNFSRVGIPADARASYRAEAIDHIRAVPGVRAAAFAAVIPISGDSSGNDVWPEGHPAMRFNMLNNSIGPGYFEAMGIPLVAGRDFDDRDVPASAPVTVVDEMFAAKLGGGADAAIGRRFTREATPSGPEKTFEIVGVVRNSSYASLKDDPYPVVYFAATQGRASQRARVVIRSPLTSASATAAITDALARLDRRIEVRYAVMPTMIRDTLVQDRLLAALSAGFGGLAAVLTMVGLYGLIAYSVTRRTGEIGIRMALGATPRDIARLLLNETGVLLAIGVLCGIGLAVAGGRAASALLFRVTPSDPVMLAGAVGLLAVIAAAASYVPARRATRIEPVAALRAD